MSALGVVYGEAPLQTGRLGKLLQEASSYKLNGDAVSLIAFIGTRTEPRVILLLVQDDDVDGALMLMLPALSPDDIIVNGTAEHYSRSRKRSALMGSRSVHYVDMLCLFGRLSAGDDKVGLFMLIGSNKRDVHAQLDAAFSHYASVAVLPVSTSGSGQYVRMVHDGLQAAFLQLYAEVHLVLSKLACPVGGSSAEGEHTSLRHVYAGWAREEDSQHFLTHALQCLLPADDGPGAYVFNPEATHESTSRLLLQETSEYSFPCPTLAAAIEARKMTSQHRFRRDAGSTLLAGPAELPLVAVEQIIDDGKNALRLCLTACFAQAFALLRAAAERCGWEMDLSELAKAWKFDGCSISSCVLEPIVQALRTRPQQHLLGDRAIAVDAARRCSSLRRVVTLSVASGLPVPALQATVAYLDAYRAEGDDGNFVEALQSWA